LKHPARGSYSLFRRSGHPHIHPSGIPLSPLEGSAYPSWTGNSVLTGHVWNAENSAGPFRYLNILWWGDKVIVHIAGQQYVYEVRSVKEVAPTDVNAMMKHEDLSWLTLVSCKGYVESTGKYRSRILVRAVLSEVK
jgi:LPXTG-site transpeptidase (sortase) family protein